MMKILTPGRAFNRVFRWPFGAAQSMKMGVGVTGRERKTHWDLEPVIEFASGA